MLALHAHNLVIKLMKLKAYDFCHSLNGLYTSRPYRHKACNKHVMGGYSANHQQYVKERVRKLLNLKTRHKHVPVTVVTIQHVIKSK